MATLPKPNRPLRILTIDGGGLDVPSTLGTLQKLLNAIARNNGVPGSRPRPCDVFDVIAGVGPGGWLALLLGRFQLDIEGALTEWYHLIKCIKSESMLRLLLLQHSFFNTDDLVEQIDKLTDSYQIDNHMFFTPPEGTRCKHVFVSALKTDWKGSHLGYNLFRTYDCPKGSNVLEGPRNPHEYKISHAFRATGAVKYFTPPRREPTAVCAISKMLGIQSDSPHNVTELALNEMWGLYGKDVEISVVVNIGPGIPNAPDCSNIARRSWWASKEMRSPSLLTRKGLFGVKKLSTNSQRDRSHGQILSARPVALQTTFGSERGVEIKEKLGRDESKIESDIREKLRNVYPENTPSYYRLLSVPERSAPGTARKYTSPIKDSLEYTKKYLRTHSVQAAMDEIGQRIDLVASEHDNGRV